MTFTGRFQLVSEVSHPQSGMLSIYSVYQLPALVFTLLDDVPTVEHRHSSLMTHVTTTLVTQPSDCHVSVDHSTDRLTETQRLFAAVNMPYVQLYRAQLSLTQVNWPMSQHSYWLTCHISAGSMGGDGGHRPPPAKRARKYFLA